MGLKDVTSFKAWSHRKTARALWGCLRGARWLAQSSEQAFLYQIILLQLGGKNRLPLGKCRQQMCLLSPSEFELFFELVSNILESEGYHTKSCLKSGALKAQSGSCPFRRCCPLFPVCVPWSWQETPSPPHSRVCEKKTREIVFCHS